MKLIQMSIKGKSSNLQKIVFEIRYLQGFVYLDKCGRTINEILEAYPEWVVKNIPDAQATGLTSLVNGCQFNFSSLKMDFSMEQGIGGTEVRSDELEHFIKQIEFVSTLVMESLDLKKFTRVGVRTWNIFPCTSELESKEWIQNLGLFIAPSNLLNAFNGTLDTVSITAVIKGEDRNFRIEIGAVERQAQFDAGQEILSIKASAQPKNQKDILVKQMKAKRRMFANPEFASLIDIDTFQEFPIIIKPRDFIESSIQKAEEGLVAAFNS